MKYLSSLRFMFGVVVFFAPIGQESAFAQSPLDYLMPRPPQGASSQDREASELKDAMKKPGARRQYLKSCIELMTVQAEVTCNRNLPNLDKTSCKNLLAKSKSDARQKCERMADGEAVSIDFK